MMRRAAGSALLVALLVNAALLLLHVWSHGGQTSELRLESQAGAYRALLDGASVVPASDFAGPKLLPLDAPQGGTVLISIPRPAPSLPRPSGIDSILITNPAGTEVYFFDDFDRLNADVWDIAEGSFEARDGVLTATRKGGLSTLALKDRGWTDYTVRLRLRNAMSGVLGSHVVQDGGVFYNFELVRDFPNFIDARKDGVTTSSAFGGFTHAAKRDIARSAGAMLTEPYPFLLIGLLAGVGLAFVLSIKGRPLPRVLQGDRVTQAAGIAVMVLAVAAFVVTFYVHREYYGAIPHLPDEVAYLFQAKLLASGRLMADIPPVREAFYFYNPSFLHERGEQWSSFYPFGQPLVLAAGTLFGAVSAVPPLIGAGTVLAIYAVGRRLYDVRTALVAAVLLATSPFFLMQASNYMSHGTAALLFLVSLLFILKRERPLLYGLVAGLSFGLAFNTRPLPALALMPPYALLLLSYLRQPESRRDGARHTLAFAAGGAVMLAAFLAYNYALTGSPTESPYASNEGATYGFVKGHTLDVGMRNQQAQLMALGLVFNNWPGFAALGLLLLPFVLGTRNRWDYFCLVCALFPIGAYTLYRFSGVYEGPRYWYEVAPFLFLLAARGAESAAAFIKGAVDYARLRLRMPTRAPMWAAAAPVYVLLLVFIVQGTGGWLFGWNDAWSDYEAHLIPNTASATSTVFEVDDRLQALAEKTELHNALVLVKPCGFFGNATCYGSVFLRNNLDFDGDVVWARFMPERIAEIIAAFPGRTVYVATWDGGASIEPYQPPPFH